MQSAKYEAQSCGGRRTPTLASAGDPLLRFLRYPSGSENVMDETNRFDKQCGRNSRPAESDVTRRTFLGATAAGAGALLVGGLISPFDALASAAADSGDAVWIEKTIPQLQALMNSGELTSLELTRGYLKRIKDLNPLLHAVIETNP